MSKKDFIAIANAIITHNNVACRVSYETLFDRGQLCALGEAFKSLNPAFKLNRWIDYINGDCGPNGGAVKKAVKK